MSTTDRMTPEHESEHDPLRPDALRRRYERIRGQRGAWEALWQDCYDYSLPARRPNGLGGSSSATRVNERLFDATAADAAEQLAATLLAQLTPPWSRWFAFQPGRDVPQDRRGAMASELDRAAELLQAQFDRSNLAVELFTSDDERAQAAAVLEKLRQHPGELQVELNKIEAAHRSVFVAGWRPAVGWICAAGVGWAYLGHPLFLWAAALWSPGLKPPDIQTDSLFELVFAMLGMAGLRSFEKTTGRSK